MRVEAGRPTDLVLDFTRRDDDVRRGQVIVTAGTRSRADRLVSLYPPNVPIGTVTRVDQPATDDQQVHLRPFADLRRMEFVQVLTKAPNHNRPAAVMPHAVRLSLRLAALALGAVIVQVAAVSQVQLFGTNADLSPLVVASVGLLCGAVPGAVFGFGTGLFLDLALVQTVGLSSLVLLGVGYWAGRLRELRDPEGALVPILVGAAATAAATVGYSLDAVPARRRRPRRACCWRARSSPPRC